MQFPLLLIILSILSSATLVFSIDPFSFVNGINLFNRADHQLNSRADNNAPYPHEWYTIDGPMGDLPDKNDFHAAYWTFNVSFYRSLRSRSPEKQKEMLYLATVEYNTILRDECWKMSNESAYYAKPRRTNTLARVASYPSEDQSDEIDPVYDLVAAVKVTCFERLKGENPNIPIKRHTKHLINALHWDKQSALQKLKKLHKQLPPPSKKSTKRNN